jgi:outer membrane assembly lipoprotein YfgL
MMADISLSTWKGLRRAALLTGAVLLLAACGSAPKKTEPKALVPYKATLAAKPLWAAPAGVPGALPPVFHAEQVLVPSSGGLVRAFQVSSGAESWRATVAGGVSSGVGFDGVWLAAVTPGNELVVLAQGKELWRSRLPSRVFTPPLVAGQRVFVQAGDRSVYAFDAATGARLWSQNVRSADALLLQQPGLLQPYNDTLILGSGGRMVGLNPNGGSMRWEAAIANPRGVNEIERLVDLVGRTTRQGAQICARAFQAAVGCIDANRGVLQWTKPANGATGVDGDATRVFGAESNGRVQAWSRTQGEVLWSVDDLLNRGLTAPAASSKGVAVGDSQGWLHVLAPANGATLVRTNTDGSPVVGDPIWHGNTLLAVTQKGGVYAWQIE